MTNAVRTFCAAATAAVAAVVLVEARDTSTVSAGFQHSCIVTADASVKCFGYNKNGELGLGDNANRGDGSGGMGDLLADVDLGAGAAATAVSAGLTHTCALLDGGSVKCWGRNNWGQLGKGDFLDRGDDPSTMGGNLTAVDLGSAPSGNGTAVATAVSTGQQFTCVLVEGGRVKCFGRNDEGQCGRGNLDTSVGSSAEDMGDSLPYVDLGEGVEVVSISSGTATTCAALLGGGIKCWGGNSYGGLGVGDTFNVGDEASDMGDNVKEVDLGSGEVGETVVLGLRHACAILVGGAVKCWGDNRSGQLGVGSIATMGDDPDEIGDDLPFVDLGSGATATSLSLGESHSCALLDDGTARCWGKSFRGQLGRGEFHAKGKYPGEMGSGLAVVDLGTGVTATSLAAGSDHTCAALGDGSLKCWGMNILGALGLGDTLDRGVGPLEMGDALPAVSLGTGVTVAPDAGVAVTVLPTVAPTPAPTPLMTPQPTPQPVAEPSPEPVQGGGGGDADQSSPQPSPAPTAEETAEVTPAPTEAAATREVGTLEAADTGGDNGVLSTKNITVAAYVAAPLLAFALLACFCFCARRRSRDREGAGAASRDSWAKGGGSAGLGGLGGHAQHGGETAAVAGTAASQDPMVFPMAISVSSKHSRKNSRGTASTRALGEANPPGGLVVGAGAGAGASSGGGRAGAGAAHGARGARGGVGESYSSDSAGTGASSSSQVYDDDAAASSVGREDELSENGWGEAGPRQSNSERILARAAANRAGRHAVPRR